MIEPHTLIRVAVGRAEDRSDRNPIEAAVSATLDDLHPPTYDRHGRRASGYSFETHRPAADPGALLGLLHVHDHGVFETLAVLLPPGASTWLADHAAGKSPDHLIFAVDLPVIV